MRAPVVTILLLGVLTACSGEAPFDPDAATRAGGFVCTDLNDLLVAEHTIVKQKMAEEGKCFHLRSTTVNVVKTVNAAGTGKYSRIRYRAADGTTALAWIEDKEITGGGVRVPR